jgi:uncharacterized protein (TIGR02099 family)
MPDTLPLPNIMPAGLRWYVRLSKWLLGLALGFWALLVLATIALHFLIVPRIIDWRTEIESAASKAWGVQVSIGELSSVSDGWVPSFEVTDFVLRDAQNEEVLRLPKLRASLSPASLFSLTLDRIELDAPVLEVQHNTDGSWRVAGMAVGTTDSSAFADWLFRQPAIQIHGGQVRWVDEQLQQAPVLLTDVHLLMHNGLRSHELRLDASPPADWGQRFSLQGQFKQALLNGRASDVSTWQGRVYAELPQVELVKLGAYIKAWSGMELSSGEGWMRVWADWNKGTWQEPTLDFGLKQLNLVATNNLPAMAVREASGRLMLQAWQDGAGHQMRAKELKAVLDDGQTWSSGDARLAWRNEGDLWAQQGELQMDAVSVAALARMAERLPLAADVRSQLVQAQPQGQLQQLDVRWSGAHTATPTYNISGHITELGLKSSAPNSPAQALWWPGAEQVQMQFQFNELAGQAQVDIQDGSLSLVDWLEEPRIPLQKAKAEIAWKKQGQTWEMSVNKAHLHNDMAQAEFNLTWKQGTANQPLGDLNLQATILRMEARSLHRYLPQALNTQTRHYMRDAITGGAFSQVKLALRGPLDRFPFAKETEGEFSIKAPFQQATYHYVPGPSLLRRDTPMWPALQQLSGELLINSNRLQVKSGVARMGPGGTVQVPKLDVQINDLSEPVVEVNALVKSNLMEAVQLVRSSPLADKVGNMLSAVQTTGAAEQQLRIFIPLGNPSLSRVQASLKLDGNDVQWAAHLPRFYKARGTLNYSESGITANGVRLRVLGADAKLDGGLRFNDSLTEGPTRLVLQGAVSAEALQQAPELGSLSSLAGLLKGEANYVASLGLRAGQVEYALSSNMQGMTIDMPDPLNKPRDAVWPLRIDSQVMRGSAKPQELLTASLGSVFSAKYLRDNSAVNNTLVSGLLQLGQIIESKDTPDKSVVLQIKHPAFNVDDWLQTISPWMDSHQSKATPVTRNAFAAYAPNRIEVNSGELVFLGRSFHQVQSSAEKLARQWRIQAKATELQGTAEYRPVQDGVGARLLARLTYLVIPPAVLEEVETTLAESPKDMPALDIVVDNLEMRGIAMGRAEIDGFARTGTTGAREWVLNKFNLTTPEASFQSKGQWGGPGKAAAKRSQLDFTLQIQDSGELLERFGHKGAIRQGKGRMAGQVGWQGSPFSPDYTTMAGQFNVNIERGQFLKADPGVTRLLGVLSLQSLPRRLTLDFKDLFSEGFAFDFVRGDVFIAQGIASTNNLQMKGVSAAVLMEGRADIQRETQDIKVVVVPELNAGTASLVYSAINPLVGLTSFLAQYVLRRPLMKSNTQEFRVEGSWKEPKVTKVEPASGKKEPETKP